MHPDLHLIYVDEVCGLFKLAGMPEHVIKKKVFPLSLKVKALTCFRLYGDIGLWDCNQLKLEFHEKFYPICIWFIMIVIIYIISGLAKEKASLKLGGGLNQCYIHAQS